MMCIGFMFLGIYPLSVQTATRQLNPYYAWSVVGGEIVTVHGIALIIWLVGYFYKHPFLVSNVPWLWGMVTIM